MFFPAYFLPSGGKGGRGIRDFTELQVAGPIADFWGFNPWGLFLGQGVLSGTATPGARKMRSASRAGGCAPRRLPAPRVLERDRLGLAARPCCTRSCRLRRTHAGPHLAEASARA